MSTDLTDDRKRELDEIVDKINKEAEMAIYYEEGTPEHERHLKELLACKERVQTMEEHERTFVEMGLMDRKDIHDFYWPELDSRGTHQREKLSRLDSEGRTRSAEFAADGTKHDD